MTKRKPPSDRRPSLQPGTPEWHAHIKAMVEAAPPISDERARHIAAAIGPDFYTAKPATEREDER